MKNVVKCYKDFFGYFNALKTHCELLCNKAPPWQMGGKKNVLYIIKESGALSLRPESSENIPVLHQEADLYFSNQNR